MRRLQLRLGLRHLRLALCVLLAVAFHSGTRLEAAAAQVVLVELQGTIGVASTLHVCRAIENASRTGAHLVIIRMDTPGGLLTATREMISCILASARPIAVYVAPSGARAASAGTYIAQAAHIAAMAPSTHIGAATPVALGPGGPRQPIDGTPEKDKGNQPRQGSEQKAVNDAVAYLKSLAELRGRNTAWAEKAVREAATLTASEAMRERVIDLVASDVADLLRQVDGRTVVIAGQPVIISTAGAEVTTVEPNWRLRLLAAISDPNIAFILLLVGFYGILFEFWSPGAIVPGVIGGVSLILALIALSVLPLSYGALGLLILGIALMTAEAFVAGFGILGIGGLVAFVFGAVFLFDQSGADFDLRLAWPVIVGAAVTAALLSMAVLVSALQSRRRKPVTGSEELIGMIGEVADWQGLTGSVHVHGEMWSARSIQVLPVGARVRIVAREGLTLIVEQALK